MKFAAKRTWPEKSPSWEHEGDAENAEAFASEFATIEQLAVDTEFVVMTKGGDGQGTRFFRITGNSPYSFVPAEPRASTAASQATSVGLAEPASAEADEEQVGMPNLRPVISMLFYMGKVAAIAMGSILVVAVAGHYLRLWF